MHFVFLLLCCFYLLIRTPLDNTSAVINVVASLVCIANIGTDSTANILCTYMYVSERDMHNSCIQNISNSGEHAESTQLLVMGWGSNFVYQYWLVTALSNRLGPTHLSESQVRRKGASKDFNRITTFLNFSRLRIWMFNNHI